MFELNDGRLMLSDGPRAAWVTLNCWIDGAWCELAISGDGEEYRADDNGVSASLKLAPAGDYIAYELSFRSEQPTRIALRLGVPDASDPFHLIPAVMFGDNNIKHVPPGNLPNLTNLYSDTISCSPYWEFRADRASHPVSMLCFDGGIAAVWIDPYSDCKPADTNSTEDFIRNGVFSELAGDGHDDACGVTVGYRNIPQTFIHRATWGEPTEHLARSARAGGGIVLSQADSRLAAHGIIRTIYRQMRELPEAPITPHETASALVDAFLTVNWDDEKENFTNMYTTPDPAKMKLTAWRTLSEVGWTGGGVIGYPLIIAGHVLGNDLALQRGLYMLDWVAKAYNPASGLLWDVCGKHDGTRTDWWWSGIVISGCHAAYVIGSGVYYLIKSYIFCKDVMGVEHPEWLKTATAALDTMVKLQKDDGNFGYAYAADRQEMIDSEGFAGIWFATAMALAYRVTGRDEYLKSAAKGMNFYHGFVADLNCWGTPMDTPKAVDQEGNLGFIRGAKLMHEITGEQQYLTMLEDGANYEYLWRYGFRARPEVPPLKGSHWNSCGGSVTSTSNPHVHPMATYIITSLKYLVNQTGDAYHADRLTDGFDWGINAVSLYPDVATYGKRGVLTERFCPSDGLLIELFPDGSPSSISFTYNGWAAAAVLEGIVEQML